MNSNDKKRSGKAVVAPLLVAMVSLATVRAQDLPERLLATDPRNFTPVTMEGGKPKFHIPPDCRLARNEHPRFLLTTNDLTVLRRRLPDPRLAPELEALKRQCDARPWEPENGVCKHALVWRLTGERKYLDAIRNSAEFRRPSFLFGWAATMDLIWDDLTPAERSELCDLVARSIAEGGSLYWRPTLHLCAVFYEGGTATNDAALLARMKRDFDDTLVRWTDKLNNWAAGRGGSDMGHGYNGEHAY